MRNSLPETRRPAPLTRIIGLGSPFGDDRAGWWVIDQLHGRLPDGVDAVSLDRPGAALINWMEGVHNLYLVDAVVDGGSAGRVLLLTPEMLAQSSTLTTHQLTIAETLRLAGTLGCRPNHVEIFGVTIATGDHPSRAVADAALTVAEQLLARVQVRKTV